MELQYIIGLAIALAGFAAVAFFFYQARIRAAGPYLATNKDTTWLVRIGDQIETVQPAMKIRRGSDKIIRFDRRQHLPYPKYSPASGQVTFGHLVSPEGELSLHVHTASPWPFTVFTSDNHIVTITTAVSFAVQEDRAEHLAKLDNFGEQFERRIHSAFQAEVGALKDEKLRESLGMIEAAVTQKLEAMEQDGAGIGIPLGIRIYEARFSFEDGDRVPGRQAIPQPASLISAPLTIDGDPDTDSAPAPSLAVPAPRASAVQAPTARRLPGAMQFAGTELDRLLDQFADRSPQQVETLMKLMELQTRQNIVELLANSGGLIVFSAEELGLSGNEVLKRRLAEMDKSEPVDPKPEN